MDTNRSVRLSIGGCDYDLILTTRAAREIGKRYGGLDKLEDAMLRSESPEEAIAEVVWLLTLLANQGIALHNLRHPEARKSPVTEEEIELQTTPADLAGCKEAISEAMIRGTRREVLSEEDTPKNGKVG